MILSPFTLAFPQLSAYDGEGEGSTGEGAGEKTYTQQEFDNHMGGLRKKYESQVSDLDSTRRDLAKQLEQASQAKGLSEEERTEFENKIATLREQFETDAEKAQRKASAKEKELMGHNESLTAASQKFQQLYEGEVTTNRIYSASTSGANKAIDPDQIVALLRTQHEISFVEDETDGEPNGRTVPRVKFNDVDKDGKPVVMTFSIEEAVDRMRELPRYANQFEDSLKGGLGGTKNAGSSKVDPKAVVGNSAEFRRMRKENPDQLAQVYAQLSGG